MFDIGLPELLLVSIVALLVIGPEKLPETIRTVSLWIGRIRRGLSNIKMEIENEIGADDIRQQLHNESIMKELETTRDQLNQGIKEAEEGILDIKNGIQQPNQTPPESTVSDQPQKAEETKSRIS